MPRPLFTGEEITSVLIDLGVTDVVWLPDSEIGRWESALESSGELRLVRVCREGEAWAIAAGLHIGGRRPVVMMQTTGLYESSDSMRNAIFDLEVPIFAIIGGRDWLNPESRDSAKSFAEPFLNAWQIDYRVIERKQDQTFLIEHFRRCQSSGQPGAVLIAENPV